MFSKILVLFLVSSSTWAAPQVVVEPSIAVTVAPVEVAPIIEAAAPAPIVETPVVKEVVAPVNLINSCRVVHEPFETQTCTPIHERVCQAVNVVNQRITYEKKCKEIVSSVCPDTDPIGEHFLVRRQVDFEHLYAPHALPVGPSVNVPCQDIRTQHCLDSPIVVDEPATLENCNVITKVQCVPIVRQIPKNICEQVEAPIPVHAPNAPVIDPLSYHHFFEY